MVGAYRLVKRPSGQGRCVAKCEKGDATSPTPGAARGLVSLCRRFPDPRIEVCRDVGPGAELLHDGKALSFSHNLLSGRIGMLRLDEEVRRETADELIVFERERNALRPRGAAALADELDEPPSAGNCAMCSFTSRSTL
jgi:hypothetical protein